MPATINIVSIQRKLDLAIKSGTKKTEIERLLRNKALDGAYQVANVLTQEFNEHPATKELLEGVEAKSKFLPDGNLASFFGLEAGRISTDISKFRELFRKFEITVAHQNTRYTVKVKFPPIKRFYDEAEAPEEYGGSWLKKMEIIGGFSKTFAHYLFPIHIDNSRSGSGIQSKYVIAKNANVIIGAIPYISDIYERVLEDVGVAKLIIAQRVRRKI